MNERMVKTGDSPEGDVKQRGENDHREKRLQQKSGPQVMRARVGVTLGKRVTLFPKEKTGG